MNKLLCRKAPLLFVGALFCLVSVLYLPQTAGAEDLAYIIPIHGEINRSTMVFVRRGINEAVDSGVKTIIFEIDTFGGRVDSALQITTLIGSIEDAETVAYIPVSPALTGVSWSAGALIALSCRRIYMAPGTSMGAATPVYQTSEGMETASEKVVSAFRTQMASLAEKNGYSKAVALAMVDSDVELLEVFVDGEMSLSTAQDLPEVERRAKDEDLSFEKGKIVSKSGKLLTLTAGEMEKYGLSSATLNNRSKLLEELQIAEIEAVILSQSLPDKAVAMVTGSAVTMLLVLIGLVALYLEISSPGFGIPGTIAIIAFAVIFIGSALLGTVGSLELLLFILGVVLLVVEIFLIPGFGVTGISGILLIVVSLVLSRQDFIWPSFDWQWDILKKNLTLVGGALLGSFVLLAVLFKVFSKMPFLNRLILETVQHREQGFTVQDQDAARDLLGARGVVLTRLRPAGKAEIGGEVLVVVSDGDFLEEGAPVEVIEVSGNRVVVRGC